MTDAEAQRHALIIASDCIDIESSTQLEVRYRGLPDDERHQIEAHLDRLSMELYQRAHPQPAQPGYPDEWWWGEA